MRRQPPRSALFPSTALFRSRVGDAWKDGDGVGGSGGLPIARSPSAVRGEGREGSEGLVRRSEEHTSELQSRQYLVCRLLLEKKHKQPSLRASSSQPLMNVVH